METKMRRRSLVFAVNGERFEVATVDPSMTLLEFIRTNTKYRGPKLGCGEGGCGACVVLLSKYDPVSKVLEESAVSSCLTLLCSVHLCSVTTSEGLGNSKRGFHSIHQRFSGFHASQCGFCTPGMCMSLFSALLHAHKSDRPDPPPGFSKLTASEAQKAVAGNLCRCTGYRPIIDACKSFASDVDIEDLGLNSFWGKERDEDVNASKLPSYDPDGVVTFPDFLKAEAEESAAESFSFVQPEEPQKFRVGGLDGSSDNCGPACLDSCWHRPTSIGEFQALLKSEECSRRIRLVVGNTCSGVYKELGRYDRYIDLKGIPELSVIQRDGSGIEIGAAVTISRAIEALNEGNDGVLTNERVVFSKIADYLGKVASHFVRNTASLGGNIIMAQKHEFASDIATILVAAASSVSYLVGSDMFTVTLEEFLDKPRFDSNFLLLRIRIPNLNEESKMRWKLLFESHRAAPRPLGNAVSYANAACLAQVSAGGNSEHITVENIRLVFGAYGTEHAVRARKVENYLTGRNITSAVMLEAIMLLRATIQPKEGTSCSDYRSSLVVGFLFDFLRSLPKTFADASKALGSCPRDAVARTEPQNALVNQNFPTKSLDWNANHTSVLSSKQMMKFGNDYLPVGAPTKKVAAELQASGEAVYVDDIPSPKDCLHGAFVYSTKPLALIKGIEFKSTVESSKITSVISIKDIPSGGKNVVGCSFFPEEPLFADAVTNYAGEPLALVIAETQKLANIAAAQSVVHYTTENLEAPILSVDEAVQRSSFFGVPSFFCPKQVGDFSHGMERAERKILSTEVKLGSQYYFYMETQTALAIPDEDNCLVVYSSSQNPILVQKTVAKCIGIPENNVRAITRRVGGGFGGKAMRSLPIATACALAAHKLGVPVRMYLDRKTDMVMIGGRHPMKINYSVGFKSDGKITALHVELLIDAGISEDLSTILPLTMTLALKKYNWGALSIDYKVCKTNLTTKSMMRGPGDVQGSFIAEAIIEHVASTLSLDSDVVRMTNLHTYESLQVFFDDNIAGEPDEYTLPYIMEKLSSTADFNNRIKRIKQFNICNRWKKRGISRVPIIYQVTVMETPGKVGILSDGSITVEVGGIELGQGLWTKVRQMVAFVLGQLCVEDLLDRVRVIQADTLSLIQGSITSGSTTSEACCEAARLACDILVERLMPLKQKLQKQYGLVSWDALVQQANMQSVNLSGSSFYVPEATSSRYLNYGAAISEVEIDVLTGATSILQSDLIYDCGQSLNPAVDLGQIEGAFVQGIGFFMLEEVRTNAEGLVTSDGTWTYKVPTVDTIPQRFNVEMLNSGRHKNRVLSSKASGEPPLLLASSVHCATREAIRAARKDLFSYGGLEGSPLLFQLPVPATMPIVKELCGFDNVERYLRSPDIGSHGAS